MKTELSVEELYPIIKGISEVRDHHHALNCWRSESMRYEIMEVIETYANKYAMELADVLLQVALHDVYLREDLLHRMLY